MRNNVSWLSEDFGTLQVGLTSMTSLNIECCSFCLFVFFLMRLLWKRTKFEGVRYDNKLTTVWAVSLVTALIAHHLR